MPPPLLAICGLVSILLQISLHWWARFRDFEMSVDEVTKSVRSLCVCGQVSQWISPCVSLVTVHYQRKQSCRWPCRADQIHDTSPGWSPAAAAAGDACSSKSVRSTSSAGSDTVDRPTVTQWTASAGATRQEMRKDLDRRAVSRTLMSKWCSKTTQSHGHYKVAFQSKANNPRIAFRYACIT